MITKVDTSSIFHCSMMNKNYLNAFRLSITLKEKIDPILLQEVVDELLHKYPSICSKIHQDNFHFYLKSLNKLKIKKDEQNVLSTINIKTIYEQALNILYKDKTISIEAFHAVSDGHGTLVYLKELIQKYIHKKYAIQTQLSNELSIDTMINDGYEIVSNQQFEKTNIQSVKPYLLPIKQKANDLKVTTIKLSVNQTKQISKNYNCSITELLTSIFYKTILEIRHEHNKDVVIAIPVNLRKHFNLNTLKNFTLLANICIKNASNDMSLKEITQKIQQEMKIQNNIHYFGNQAKKIGQLSKNILIKYCPIFIKTNLIRLVNHFVGNNACMTISNVGRIQFDDPQIHNYIESMDAILSPKQNGLYNCGIIAINDNIHINITHDYLNIHLIEKFKEELNKMNLVFLEKEYGI